MKFYSMKDITVIIPYDEQGFECGVDNGARSITIGIPPYKRFR